MVAVETISSVESLVQWMRTQKEAGRQIVPQGSGTRSAPELTQESTQQTTHQLGQGASDCSVSVCSLSGLHGVTVYEPSEYLISARAGTKIADLEQELASNGQFLPFDTSILPAEATLGGTLAIGASGPRRQLYGAIRDFVMEVRMVDGLCNVVRGGGRVVKNAAGFDLPKLMVGSLGRLGIMTEVTLKVFPRPAEWQTVAFLVGSTSEAIELAQLFAARPFPIAGIAILESGRERLVLVGLAGPDGSLESVTQQMLRVAEGRCSEVFVGDEFETSWAEASEFAKRSGIVRTVQNPRHCVKLDAFCSEHRLASQIWSAGEVTWVDPGDELSRLADFLQRESIAGLHLPIGQASTYRIGDTSWTQVAERIRSAIDPDGLFLAF